MQLRGRSFWTNALINFIRTGLTAYVLGDSLPVPYLPYALTPAHTALTILMVLFLSAREAFSEENSKGSWSAQLLLIATLIPLAIRLAAALIPKNYNNVCGFFGIPKIPLPCLNSNDIETPQLNW